MLVPKRFTELTTQQLLQPSTGQFHGTIETRYGEHLGHIKYCKSGKLKVAHPNLNSGHSVINSFSK